MECENKVEAARLVSSSPRRAFAFIVFILSGVFGGSLLLAFSLQWQQAAIDQNAHALAQDDRKRGPEEPLWRFLLRSCALCPIIVTRLSADQPLWPDSAGIRFILPLGLGLCLVAWLFGYFLFLR